MSAYHTMPDDHLQRRARYDLQAADNAATDVRLGQGDREVFRMAFTLGAIERVLDEIDFAGDETTAGHIARIRARVQAYQEGTAG